MADKIREYYNFKKVLAILGGRGGDAQLATLALYSFYYYFGGLYIILNLIT